LHQLELGSFRGTVISAVEAATIRVFIIISLTLFLTSYGAVLNRDL